MINMFVNAKHDSNSLTMVCKLSDRFKVLEKCVKIDQALYSLRDSLALWYKEFKLTLLRIGLSPLKEEPYIFINTNHKVFIIFFVNNI